MKRNIMLGINESKTKCCVLECLLSFNDLDENEIKSKDFCHDCTNWCGCDDIKRTLRIIDKSVSGNIIKLKKPIKFHGKDFDMGHCYEWTFEVSEIWELK